MSVIEEIRYRARAIEAALEDSLPGAPCRVYFDTDVVVGCFFRYREILKAVDESSQMLEKGYVSSDTVAVKAKALWSAGYGCVGHMLWSHVLELNERIDHPEYLEVNLRQLRRIFEIAQDRLGIRASQSLDTLLDVGMAAIDREVGDSLSKTLSVENFALALACIPSWTDRVRLMGDRLDRPKTKDWYVESGISQYRFPDIVAISVALQLIRKKHTVASALHWMGARNIVVHENTYRDVRALAELNQRCSSPEYRTRFFTRSSAIYELLEGPRAKAVLPNLYGADGRKASVLGSGPLDEPSGPMRSEYYMYIRSLVSGVMFEDRREAWPERKVPAIADRNDLTQLVASAKELVIGAKEGRPVGAEASEWLRQLARLEASCGVTSIWANKAPEPLEYLKQVLPLVISSGFSAVMKVVEQNKAAVNRASNAQHQFAKKQIDELYVRINQAISRVSDPGVNRWMLIGTDPFGDIDGAVQDVVARYRLQNTDFSGKTEEWKEMVADERASKCAKLLAAAVLLARGEHVAVAYAPLVVKYDSKTPYVEKCIELGCLLLQRSALILAGSAADVVTTDIDATPWQTAIAAGGERVKRARARCYHAMYAWESFYWCHQHVEMAGGDVDTVVTARADRAMTGLRAFVNFGKDYEAHGENRQGMVECSALREDVVAKLLGCYGSIAPEESGAVLAGDAYAADADAWRFVCKWRRDGADKQRMVMAVKRATEALAEHKVREKYLTDHLGIYKEVLGRK